LVKARKRALKTTGHGTGVKWDVRWRRTSRIPKGKTSWKPANDRSGRESPQLPNPINEKKKKRVPQSRNVVKSRRKGGSGGSQKKKKRGIHNEQGTSSFSSKVSQKRELTRDSREKSGKGFLRARENTISSSTKTQPESQRGNRGGLTMIRSLQKGGKKRNMEGIVSSERKGRQGNWG